MPVRVQALLNGDLADPDAPLLRGDGVSRPVLVVDGVALQLDRGGPVWTLPGPPRCG